MGCGGSQHDVREKMAKEGDFHEKNQIHNGHADDEEILVISHGKPTGKSQLDQITENNLNTSKIEAKNKELTNNKNDEKVDEVKIEIHSNSVYVNKDQIEEDNFERSKTSKLEFEKHPHEFDFSFIEEKQLEKREEDLLNDEILKEMKEMIVS